MARLLRDLDYERVVQDADLAQIVNNNPQANFLTLPYLALKMLRL